MKIAHLITGSIFAGIEQHVYELAQSLNKKTSQIIICGSHIQEHLNKVDHETIELGSRYSPINILKLRKFVKQNDVDILHCHGSKSSTIGNLLRLFDSIKIVSTIHGHKRASNSVIKKSHAVIGVNKKLINGIENAVFIPNWFNPVHQGIPSSRSGPILAIGRLEKVKGFDLLIRSWINIDIPLEIIGSGQEEKSLSALIKSHGLEKKISIITDYSYTSIEEKYKSASGLIISSLREGGPRVVLEAINHDIPVLGTKVGILPQLISKEFLVEPNNQEKLQILIEEMLPLFPQMNMAALKDQIHENYSIKSASQATLNIYESLLRADS